MAVQIILKNSSIEDKKPTPSQLTNGEISLNYSSAGAFLCCTDTDGNTQQVGGVKIDETAPDAPVKQSLWFRPSTLTLSVYDGDKWLPIAGGGGGGGGGGGDIIQIIGNDGIDADTIAGIVTLDVELAGGDDGLEFKSSKLSASLASATQLGSVKVGSNLEVAAGVISVPPASDTVLGVVKQGDGVEIAADGTISVDVPQTTTYRGKCNLSATPTGQLTPDPAERGDGYINDTETASIDVGWSPLTGTAKIGDLVIFDGADWQLFPFGAGSAPVTSVNTKTGDVVLDYTDVGAASEAQGDLADTALQPGDNISELVNDAEYISKGDNVSELVNDAEYVSKGDNVSDLANDAGYITAGDIPDQAPPVIISDTAPLAADSEPGDLWFNTNDGRTYVYYEDADSSQWVDASPNSEPVDTSLWLENGGYLSPKDGTNGVELGSGAITLNVDGRASFGGTVNAGGNKSLLQGVSGIISHPIASFSSAIVGTNYTAGGRVWLGQNSTAQPTSEIFENGSASFAGEIKSGSGSNWTTLNRSSDNVNIFVFTDSTAYSPTALASAKFVLFNDARADGAASTLEFVAKNTQTTSAVGQLSYISETANDKGAFAFKTKIDSAGNSLELLRLNSDGSASFAGQVDSGNISTGAGCRLNAGGVIEIRKDNAAGAAFTALTGGTSQANAVATINYDGSAEFAGAVKIGGTLPSAPNISLNADGAILTPMFKSPSTGAFAFIRADENVQVSMNSGAVSYTLPKSVYIQGFNTSTGLNHFAIDYDGTAYFGNDGSNNPNITLNADGTANFASDVKIGGTLPSAPNIELRASTGIISAGNSGTTGTMHVMPEGLMGRSWSVLADGNWNDVWPSKTYSGAWIVTAVTGNTGTRAVTVATVINALGNGVVSYMAQTAYVGTSTSQTIEFRWNGAEGRNAPQSLQARTLANLTTTLPGQTITVRAIEISRILSSELPAYP